MKFIIEYRYCSKNMFPFIALTQFDNYEYLSAASDKSFEDAKNRLIEKITDRINLPEIPKPETIEINH